MRRYVTISVGLALALMISAQGLRAQAEGSPQHASSFNDAGFQADQEYQVQPASCCGDGYAAGDYDASGPCGCEDGSGGCDDGSCGYGDCATCYDWWPGDDRLFGGPCGDRCGRLCIGADYLYVRASASHATAYTAVTAAAGSQYSEIYDLDFRHESSYRLRGSYGLDNCGEELRFTFTRFNSYADAAVTDSTVVGSSITAPFLGAIPDGGQLLVDADVDVKAYDLELAKTIPLGGTTMCNGSCGCGCGDTCGGGCGCGGCETCCPAWDITWSGGIRFADADWRRTFEALDAGGTAVERADTLMNFEGGGVRMGLEGRRYLGCAGIFSVFLRGDLSLLLGNLDMRTVVADLDLETEEVTHSSSRNVIPVTEIEGGLTAQLSCHTRLTGGYMFGAWHDLGFRNDTSICLDGANILAFDGMFVRLEGCF
jgi:hypothetical protein